MSAALRVSGNRERCGHGVWVRDGRAGPCDFAQGRTVLSTAVENCALMAAENCTRGLPLMVGVAVFLVAFRSCC